MFGFRKYPNISNKNKWVYYDFFQTASRNLLYRIFRRWCKCCLRKNEREMKVKMLKKAGRDRLEKDLDGVKLINTIYKIKAALKVIIAGDRKLYLRTMTEYFKNKSIYLNSDSEAEQT